MTAPTRDANAGDAIRLWHIKWRDGLGTPWDDWTDTDERPSGGVKSVDPYIARPVASDEAREAELSTLRTRVDALTRDRDAALALPVEPAKPDEVGMARDKVVEAAKDWHLATWNEDDYADALVRAVDALLAAERASKEGGS